MCLGFTRDILIGQMGSHEKEMQHAQMCVSFSIEKKCSNTFIFPVFKTYG